MKRKNIIEKKRKFNKSFFDSFFYAISNLDFERLQKIILQLKKLKKRKGRLFFIGVGGSASNASHAVNDFRKLCEIEAYTPLDNVSELTARINDEGWETSLTNWLKGSNINNKDAIFVFSVGGGDLKKKVSLNLINSIKFAKNRRITIIGIVGRKNSYLFKSSKLVLPISIKTNSLITPVAESFQSIIWHYLVSHPELQVKKTKW
jgi:D-sedoheptulose 7-phosphate isomerase